MEDNSKNRDDLIGMGYKLINGEYIRHISLLRAAEVENFVERDVTRYFKEVGYEIRKVPKGPTRTVDYEFNNLGIEVTALHDYLPNTNAITSLIKRLDEKNTRICAYMFLENNHQIVRVLKENQLTGNVSMVCLMQHVSCYKPKILQKVIDKYIQDELHQSIIIVIDFRLAHFDSLSLKRAIKEILEDYGKDLPSLEGILISVPKYPDSEMFESPEYVFVRNERCAHAHEMLKVLSNFSSATTKYWMTVNHIFVRYRGLSSVKSPCMDCPDKEWLEQNGFPTM